MSLKNPELGEDSFCRYSVRSPGAQPRTTEVGNNGWVRIFFAGVPSAARGPNPGLRRWVDTMAIANQASPVQRKAAKSKPPLCKGRWVSAANPEGLRTPPYAHIVMTSSVRSPWAQPRSDWMMFV